MMTTLYWILGVLVYFQETTTSLVTENWQNIQPCQDPQCPQYQLAYQQPISQYASNLDQQVSSSNYHPVIQNVPIASYIHPADQSAALTCPFGHALASQQGYQLDNQQKSLEAQYRHTKVHQFQASAEQIQDYKPSHQELNNGYLPPNNQLQLDNVDIHQNQISSVSQEESNNDHLQVINQNQQLLNVGIYQNQINEQSQQQLNSNYLQVINQNQHVANVGIQQNQYASSGLSQHQGKIKQTVKYDISHGHQPSHHQYSQNKNVYSDAKSSTNIEQHHDLHHHSEGSEESHEIDVLTGKKKKDHNAYYKFDYSVNDQHTGDIKKHTEERSGDEVTGEYSLVEEDGNVRTVKYFADWKTGFHATVHNSKPRS